MYLYSASTRGFYTAVVHGENIPADAVEVSIEEYVALIVSPPPGKVILPDVSGRPTLQDPPIGVPPRVTMRQARLALLQAGLLDEVEAALAALPGDEGRAARIEWDYSSEVWRNKPFVQQLAVSIGLSEAQLDELFITAAGIE